MAQFQTRLSLTGAYSVDATLLEDIVERAKAFLQSEVTIEVNFSDVHYIKTENLEEVVQDSLVRTDVITGISILGRNARAHLKFFFKVRNNPVLPTIVVEIEGPQDACRSLSTHIERLLKVKRQWYSPIVPNNSFVSFATFFVAVSIVLVAPIVLTQIFVPPKTEPVAVIHVLGWVAWIVLVLWLTQFLFPKLIVEIGRSAEIASRKRGVRTGLFVSVILALVVGVAAALIATGISR
jgi:hypothetical protein